MRVDVLTLFPEIFSGYVSQSLLHKAIQSGLVSIHLHDIRSWSKDKFNRVDDRPFGGGPGMVLMVEPVVDAIESVLQQSEISAEVVLLTPQGRRLDQRLVEQLATLPRLLLVCGRYEGFDHRIIDIIRPTEVSIGDFVLNGGEVAAMTIIDAVIRLIPGVLGDEESSRNDSFSTDNRLLEFPQYTRPRDFRGQEVPEILLSGNHAKIEEWRRQQSLERTLARRADLLPQEPRLDEKTPPKN